MANPDALFVSLAVQRGLATPQTAQECVRQAPEGQGLARLLAERAGIPLHVARELHAEAQRMARRPNPPPPAGSYASTGPTVSPVGESYFAADAPTLVGDLLSGPQGSQATSQGTGYQGGSPHAPPPGAAGRFQDPFAPPPGYSSSGSHVDARLPGQSAPSGPGLPGGVSPSDTRQDTSRSGSGPFPHTLLAGSQFGRYRLEEELGRGAMGIVWRARQVDLDRDVAIKMLLQGPVAGDKVRARFMAEARSVARLVHPNIVAIHDVGEQDGIHFFTMDYVDGPPLSEYIKSNTVSFERALEIARDIAEALDYAHQNGIVHRDLKPANILLNNQGTARITDFGIAKDTTVESHTQAGEMLGTPAYMSPEQASGRSDTVDGRADVYSLGAILYRILTGKAPFEGKTPYDVIRKVAVEKPVPPRKLNGQVPRDVDAIILRCLAKEREERYASAGELAKALEQARRSLRQRPRSAAAGGGLPLMALHAALILIGVGGVGAAVWWRFVGSAATPVDGAPVEVSDAAQEGAVIKAEAALATLLAGGDFAQARLEAEQAVEQAPARVEVHAALAAILLEGQQAEAALAQADQALELEAGSLPARRVRARALLALERPAAEIRDEALRLESLGTDGKIAAAELLAEHALSLSSYSVAIEHLREAVSLAPGDAGRRLRLAEVYLRAGRHQQAEEEARAALTRDEGLAGAHLIRAQALEAMGQRREALEAAEAARDLDSGLAEATALAERLREAPAPSPTPSPTQRPPPSPAQGQDLHQHCHAALEQGMQAIQQKNPQQAQRCYQEAFQDSSFSCPDGLLQRAQLGLMLGRVPRVLEDLQRLHQAHGAQPQSMSLLAQALSRSDRVDEALKVLDAADQQVPNHPGMLATRARVLQDAGRFAEAAEAWRRFGELTPQDAEGPHNAAHAWEKANRLEEAVRDFRNAIERHPEDGHLHTALGKALDALGQGDDALREFEAALEAPQLSPADRKFAQQRVSGGGR